METDSERQSGLALRVPVIGILRGIDGGLFGEVMAASAEGNVTPPLATDREITISSNSLFERITAEEIWAQMDGRIDGFTCAAGTGGAPAATAGSFARSLPATRRCFRLCTSSSPWRVTRLRHCSDARWPSGASRIRRWQR